MKIKNIEGLTPAVIRQQVNEGGRFVYFTYTISFIIVTFRNVSGVYLIRPEEKRINKSFLFSLASCLFGWWGIPWGPRHTIQAIRTNWKGGKDVTDEVMGVMEGYLLFKEGNAEENHNFIK